MTTNLDLNYKTFTVTEEHYTLQASCAYIGRDLLITLVGGDCPHIGTVSSFSKMRPLETSHFPSHSGRFHKDDVLAQVIAKIITPALLGNCAITCGVHVNGISKAQIQASGGMATQLGQAIKTWLESTPPVASDPVYYTQENKLTL